jgi:putative ABC transport system ATP-binding protein
MSTDTAQDAKNQALSTTREETETIIDVTEVFKIYKTESIEVVALRGLDLSVKRGEIISIMGPSGCGKSTMLNIIGALDTPSAGKIRVLGQDLTSMDSDAQIEFRRKHIGFVFQFFNLVPTLTAIENIELPLRLVNTPHEKMRKKVTEVLNLVGMEKRGNHRPDELSGGEQQRIAIAAALANDPEIILADEPTGELDSESGQKVLDLLKYLNEDQGKTIIIVTHDPRSATISHRSFRIEDGQIKGEYTREMYLQDGSGGGEGDDLGDGSGGGPGMRPGGGIDPLRYKKMIENMVDKKRRMEELLKEIINMEDEMINGWK